MKTTLSIFIFLSLLIHSLCAQDKEPDVNIDFQAFLWPSHAPIAAIDPDGDSPPEQPGTAYTPPEVAYLENGKGSTKTFQLLDDRLTGHLQYRGSQQLTFYKPGTEISNPEARVELGRIAISPSAKELTIFFLPQANGKYQLFSIETSATSIPPGNTLIYNLSTTRLACKLDTENFTIDSGKYALKQLSLPNKHYQPILVASLRQDGEWQRSLARKLIVDKSDRLLLIIYNLEANPNSYNLMKLVFRPN
ncbi:MAG TPA: hypothetical protein DEA90_12495 [Opitutae bacterium]|nr:hypothetical protein [Puniceicoccaceae bacterium]HBR94972.1 hypothetical protein [Opitutae bacterium]|tara:strand:- start:4221 stop:4967 length:747 start_codon:yes stop_codon:yes gene_type:complete